MDRLVLALEALAKNAGFPLPPSTMTDRLLDASGLAEAKLGEAVEGIARVLDIELEPADMAYGEIGSLVASCAPALLVVTLGEGAEAERRLVTILRCRRDRAIVVGPDGGLYRLPVSVIERILAVPLERDLGPEVEELLDTLALAGARRRSARRYLLTEKLRHTRIGCCWLLRLRPGAALSQDIREAGLPSRLAGFVVAHSLAHGLFLASWWVLGAAVLQGRLSQGWFLAWILILASLIPLRAWNTWERARLAVATGALLKRRLLDGSMRLEPDEIRREGAGQLLGRVLEAEEVESRVLQGGFLGMAGVIELAFAAWVLSQGAAPAWQLVGFGLWIGVASWAIYSCFLARCRWTVQRLDMTHDMVERTVGYRTRLVQEHQARWHDEDDAALERYGSQAAAMDRKRALLLEGVPRGWLVVGTVCLAPVVIGGASPPLLVVIALGGVLASYRGFLKLTDGVEHLISAVIAWQQVRRVFGAAQRPVEPGFPGLETSLASAKGTLEVVDLSFRYRDRGRSVIEGFHFAIAQGDRILVEGVSGVGKSTLVALLAGLRDPHSGLLLLDGMDRHTLGEDWRRFVVPVPQFHENHVFTGTLAFNLLMGKRWPPQPQDLEEAEAACRGLGLGSLLDEMPAGLQQVVGETGWQLSHGERSRVYVARALLQGGKILLLDESFAGLDSASLEQVLTYLEGRVPAILAVGHL